LTIGLLGRVWHFSPRKKMPVYSIYIYIYKTQMSVLSRNRYEGEGVKGAIALKPGVCLVALELIVLDETYEVYFKLLSFKNACYNYKLFKFFFPSKPTDFLLINFCKWSTYPSWYNWQSSCFDGCHQGKK